MQAFAYIARDERGQQVSGTLTAVTSDEVQRMLRADGKYPIEVKPHQPARSAGAGISVTGIRAPRADILQISQQLAIMLETGVTLPDALDCIVQQTTHPRTRALVEDLARQVKQGVDFSAALSRHGQSFPRLYIALVRASEKSGMMPKLLARAASYMRDEADVRRRVKGALTYPCIMFGFALIVTIFLLAFVLPRFTAIYANKKAALPLPTKILMNASDLLVHHWMILLPATLVGIVGLVMHLRTESGRRHWHWVQLRLPLLGSMFRQLHLARGMRMMGTMGSGGVPLSDSVEVTADLADNYQYRDLWQEVGRQLQTGKQLSEPLARSPLVPPSIAQMIKSGEKSGKLSHVLEQLAGFSEEELKEKVTEMTRYIEPAMIIAMGVLIGSVALALLLPVFTISKVMAS